MQISKGGIYSATHSDLFIKVYSIYHISERTGKINMKCAIFRKSDNNLYEFLTPYGPKNMKFIYDVAKHWKHYAPKGFFR